MSFEIAETLHLGLSTVHRTRQRFVDEVNRPDFPGGSNF